MSSRLQKLILMVVIVGMVLSGVVVLAQDNTSRALVPDIAVSGSLDADTLAEVYTLLGISGQVLNITATPATEGRLGILLTDASGVPVAQATGEPASLVEATIVTSGIYYVTVIAADGVGDGSIDYSLVMTLVTPPAVEFNPPGELLTVTGMQISLTWNSGANLDLEVRDPVGGSLFWETPNVPSGGVFGENVNGACNALITGGPREEAQWPAGVIPTGSYELIVYFQQQQDCPNNDPVSVTLSAVVDGNPIEPIEGTLLPNQIYLANFVVAEDGTVTTGLHGVKVDPPTVQGVVLTNSTPINLSTTLTGAITNTQPYQVYGFEGQAGQVVSIQMNAVSGSLDTLLLLVDQNGNIVTENDDVERGITNSAIQNYSLVASGSYRIVATRYGQALGGTEGDYEITFSGAATAGNGVTVQAPTFSDLPRGSVEVSLQWATNADIQLLVRDPSGEAVYDARPTIPSGGVAAAIGNDNCQAALSGTPLSYIYWPEGRLPPAGPYEIEVLYQNTCNDTQPVTFSLNVVSNGQVVLTATELLRPDERYVTSYNIGLDGSIEAGEGGVFGTKQVPDSSSLDIAALIPSAQLVSSGETVTGSIRLNQRFNVYAFEGTAGQVATIGLEQLNGTLDPVVFLIDPNGVQIAQNDDASLDTRNSLINAFPLPQDGRYIIIATHFGGRYGVTAGDYRLSLRLN
ncbi:MAG: PPC domain-containing protein [Anaerolineae bacterium]|nr:PPC domain-containing protein [Anaerolineae bacterium]